MHLAAAYLPYAGRASSKSLQELCKLQEQKYNVYVVVGKLIRCILFLQLLVCACTYDVAY